MTAISTAAGDRLRIIGAAAILLSAGAALVAGDRVVELGIVAILAALAVAGVSRRPVVWMVAMVAVLLPLYQVTTAFLYEFGLPLAVVRSLAGWRELLMVGLAVAVMGAGRRQRIDHLDVIAVLYVAVVTFYLLFPQIAAGRAAPPLDLDGRVVAFRANVGYAVLFVLARRVQVERDQLDRFGRAVGIVGVVLAAGALVEVLLPNVWQTLVVDFGNVFRYKREVLQDLTFREGLHSTASLGGIRVVRAGSFLFEPVALAFTLLIPFAVLYVRMLRPTRSRGDVVALSIVALGILASQTRTALAAMVLVVVVVTARARAVGGGPNRPAAARMARVLVVLALVVPAASALGLFARVGGVAQRDASTEGHIERTTSAVSEVVNNPAGRGLGSVSGSGARLNPGQVFFAETSYLHLAVEVGVVAMALFVALLLAALRRLRAMTGEAPAAAFALGSALALAGLVLPVWFYTTVSLGFWVLVGLTLATGRAGAVENDRSADDQVQTADGRLATVGTRR